MDENWYSHCQSGQQVVYVIGLHCTDTIIVYSLKMIEQDGSTCLFLKQNILEHYSLWSAAILSVRKTNTVLINTELYLLVIKMVAIWHMWLYTFTNYVMTITYMVAQLDINF